MEHVASSIGLSLPVIRARDAVMKCERSTRRPTRPTTRRVGACHASTDMKLCSRLPVSYHRSAKDDDDDDDTASTASMSSRESQSFSSTATTHSAAGVSVTFAEPVVTAVYERPATTQQEKRDLFYSDLEYRQFRRDYLSGVVHRDCVVKFAEEVVTEVWVYKRPQEEDSSMFYSQADLQSFLDEFVASLS